MAENRWLQALSFMTPKTSYGVAFTFVFTIGSLALAFLTYMLSIHTLNFLHGKTTSSRIKATAERSVNRHLGQTQFQVKIDNLSVKDYAKRAIKGGTDGSKIFADSMKAQDCVSINDDQDLGVGVQPLIEEEPGDFSDLDEEADNLATSGLRQRGHRVRGSRVSVEEIAEEVKSQERSPKKKDVPSPVTASVINCFKFCKSRKQDQT